MTDKDGRLQIAQSDKPVGKPGDRRWFFKLPDDVGCDPVTGKPQPLQLAEIDPSGGGFTLVGSEPATRADIADARSEFRGMLLGTAGVQARLREMAALADGARAPEVKRLSDQLRGVLTPREIEHAVSNLERGQPLQLSLIGHTGSGRKRGRGRHDESLRLAATAYGLHAGGKSLIEADEIVADHAGVKGARRTREEITKYRSRAVRDAMRLRPE